MHFYTLVDNISDSFDLFIVLTSVDDNVNVEALKGVIAEIKKKNYRLAVKSKKGEKL